MNAIGYAHAEELLTDLGGTRLYKIKTDGSTVSEWETPAGRVVLAQGSDDRLRLYTLAAETDRIKSDAFLDAVVLVLQQEEAKHPRSKTA